MMFFLWVKQCHEPPIWVHGVRFIPPILSWWLGDGLWLFYPHYIIHYNTILGYTVRSHTTWLIDAYSGSWTKAFVIAANPINQLDPTSIMRWDMIWVFWMAHARVWSKFDTIKLRATQENNWIQRQPEENCWLMHGCNTPVTAVGPCCGLSD